MPHFVRSVPPGDTRERAVCQDCGHVEYRNPLVVVGSVIEHAGGVVLCRRAIEPGYGLWTLPAGYLELGETTEEGACREAMEECGASIVTQGVLAVFSIARIGQVQVIFRARFADPNARPLIAAGTESLEVGLFGWTDIPWDTLAFPSVRWALDASRAAWDRPLGQACGNPAEDRRGVVPPPALAMRPSGEAVA